MGLKGFRLRQYLCRHLGAGRVGFRIFGRLERNHFFPQCMVNGDRPHQCSRLIGRVLHGVDKIGDHTSPKQGARRHIIRQVVKKCNFLDRRSHDQLRGIENDQLRVETAYAILDQVTGFQQRLASAPQIIARHPVFLVKLHRIDGIHDQRIADKQDIASFAGNFVI